MSQSRQVGNKTFFHMDDVTVFTQSDGSFVGGILRLNGQRTSFRLPSVGGIVGQRTFVPGQASNVWAQSILDAFQAEEGGHIVIEGGEKFDTHTTPFIVRCHVRYDCLEIGRGEANNLPEARLLAARAVWTSDLGPPEPTLVVLTPYDLDSSFRDLR